MYHAIVRRNVRKLFEALGRADIDYVVAGMAPRFERLFRVLPELRFEIRHMAVSGMPWNTTVVVEWRDYATLADGSDYVNDGAHAIQIRWGKVIVLHAYLDTAVMIDAMRAMAKAGVTEALAPKIED